MVTPYAGMLIPYAYAGMRIIEDWAMVDVVEDWSDVRSPSRARRRLKRGFKQRLRYRAVPKPEAYVIDGALVMHPEMAKKLRRRLSPAASL